tara:strand:+ start:3418 stop:4260 length:843 start_codon:yes stop_codon:yes gene_type:complete
MSNITVVTTFNKEGMDKYGQRFITSFEDNVDDTIKLLVYAENCFPAITKRSQIFEYQATKELPKLNNFKKRWKDIPKANGIPPDNIKAKRPRDWHKEFKWNAIRFANKVYAVFDAFDKSDNWCVWMDADTFVHSPWSRKQFKSLLPDDKWLTYVGRGKGSQTWPECGFYGMNKNNPMCVQFLKEFERFYEDAENGIFELEEWHDSYVFGHILNQMKSIDNNVLDYSAEMYLKEAKTGGGGHPLINTVLGKYIDHMKGDRKNTGRSLKKDLMVNRRESYWQ